VSGGEGRHPLSIGQVAGRTGLSEGTLRMWETRYGFPSPERLTSGHRRYSERDVELLRQVLEERERGLSLKVAVERVLSVGDEPERSLFAGLRRRRPELSVNALPKHALVPLSHAIEDELCVRAERSVLFGSFQHERHYRAAERRWRELARTADYAVVVADFKVTRRPRRGPVEVPLERTDPLLREWALVCASAGYAACLAGIERPGREETPELERRFDTVWSVDPDVVDDAARIACDVVAGSAPRLAREMTGHLDRAPAPSEDRFEVAAAVTSRMVAYLGDGASGVRPE
jgi:MerR family transcriptional regulator, light-induced transcriptional regulator